MFFLTMRQLFLVKEAQSVLLKKYQLVSRTGNETVFSESGFDVHYAIVSEPFEDRNNVLSISASLVSGIVPST